MLQIFHKKSSKGFTLIELLVVIAIIGVLASIVLASLNTARQKGRDTRRVADIKNVQTALELYYDSNNSYPTGADWATAMGALVTGGQLQAVPLDPRNISPNVYTYAYYPGTNPTRYHLSATLEDSGSGALTTDKDCDSTAATCPGGAAYSGVGINGTGTNVYDIVN